MKRLLLLLLALPGLALLLLGTRRRRGFRGHYEQPIEPDDERLAQWARG